MSHHFIVPTNENGLSLDADIGGDIALAMGTPFGITNVFLYSHGWWTDAIRAMQGYNRFTIEFSAQFRSTPILLALPTLNIGIHWPSTLTEDHFSLLNYVEALSFFTMEKRADTVGENCGNAILKFILNSRLAGSTGPLNIHLVGHSFGCKVVCVRLQTIADDSATNPLPGGVTFNLALIEAAFDYDELEAQNDYGSVAGLPGLRLLVTRSDRDSALASLYPKAHELAHLFHHVSPALGSGGPSPGVINLFGGMRSVVVGPNYDPATAAPLKDRLIVADLTSLHDAHPENNDSFSGHHSDIFHTEIYKLLTSFFFGS